jgi:putative thioredoxin
MTTQTPLQRGDFPAVVEVDERTFGQEVLVRSQEVPVVVDFWAPWCGPCRTLGPTLERLANEADGAFVLAKVNVDQNQRLAMNFQVQGIPAVKAFRDGKVVDEFTGALPENQIRAWLQGIAPAPADSLAEEAAKWEANDPEQAVANYRRALELDPQHAASLFGLGRMLIETGDSAGGAEALRAVPAGTPFYARAQGLLGMVDFFAGADDTDPAGLQARVADNPNDLEARYRLAASLAQQEQYAEAMEQLIQIVMRNRAFHDDGARKALLALFETLGDEHPLVQEYRRKLANALF